MNLKETNLVRIWTNAAQSLNGKFSMPLQKVNGGSAVGGVYLFGIDFKYKEVAIRIHAGIYELPLQKNEYNDCPISITAIKESQDSIELSIWRKDFFDKIFKSSNYITGYEEFDKVIELRASKNIERLLSLLFKNQNLRNEFITDKYRVYNIQTINKYITINRKSGLEIKTAQMIIDEFDRFSLFLDGLIESKII